MNITHNAILNVNTLVRNVINLPKTPLILFIAVVKIPGNNTSINETNIATNNEDPIPITQGFLINFFMIFSLYTANLFQNKPQSQ